MNKLKKMILIILCILLTLACCGCNGNQAKVKTKTKTKHHSKSSSSQQDNNSENSSIDEDLEFDTSDSDITDIDMNTDDTSSEQEMLYKYTFNSQARVYLSNSKNTFIRQNNAYKIYDKKSLDSSSGIIVNIKPNSSKQEIEGFGGALTDTSAKVLSALPENTRSAIMEKLFDNNKGIGLSMIRGCIGTSDFSDSYYTYDDMSEGKEDWSLSHFDMSHDQKQIIPLIKQATKINKNIKVVLSPWSPPLWMKTKFDWQGSSQAMLRVDCYDVYANYLIKSIKGYQDSGIPIYAFTIQNEPQGLVDWPGCIWDGDQMANFISIYMRPAMNDNDINSKLWIWDHNYLDFKTPLTILSQCREDIDGIAWHWYKGTPEQMEEVGNYYDDVPMYITENGTAVSLFYRQLLELASGCVRAIRSGARNYITWNLALDLNGGPTYNDINNGCSGIVRVDNTGKEIQYTAEFFGLAHFSKFIHVGAKLIDSTDTGINTKYKQLNLITRNPNGSMTAVLVNNENRAKVFKLVMDDQVMEIPISGNSVLTITWDANT